MKLVNSQNRINELMSRFTAQIKGGASMGKTDLNKAAETILIPLLNEVYGWNLKNINYAEDNNNYPGIDLADEIARISIQVTATPAIDKVKHTLEQFVKNSQHVRYDRLIVYILKDKQDSYSGTAIQKIIQGRFNFDPRKDIWDCHDILKEISNFQIDRALRVQEILEANFGDDNKGLTPLVSELEQRIDWRETCRKLLNHWKGLTTNVLTTSNGVRFQLDEIFVPLGVVERRQKPKHHFEGGSPEQGSELYEEKVTPISQDDFFEQVLRQRQSKNSQGSRIAIIGEPGAGKTTQLQKIGDWILKETDDIPIWISLAAVGTKTLKEYLLNDWLQTATPELEISQQVRDELGQLLKTGKVWLLLDGVDEMAIADALHQISIQMRERWLQNVRVVLTCRLNVWDAGKNALDCFDVYRNLDFDYPNQVHQFIDRWFATEPELQQNLKSALERSGKERIRDMVKNPLRLTLLCYSWQIQQGELPETKAGLYEWFVDMFYKWDKDKVSIKLTTSKRKELNHALGELAKAAIDQDSSRFRLREKFINQFLDYADDEDSLFYLALQLGWLNRIGIAEENPLEDVYAFFHPTFQEYFAALAIEDWDYFLPCDHNNNTPRPLAEKVYRIFELQWEEIIILWISHTNETVNNQKKSEFIYALINFRDGCGDLYSYQVLFLLAFILSEWESVHTEPVLETLLKVAFGEFDEIGEVSGILSREAKGALRKSNLPAITKKILNLFAATKDEKIHLRLASALVDINPYAQDSVMNILESSLTSKDNFVKGSANLILSKTSRLNSQGKIEVERPSERKIRCLHQGEFLEIEEDKLIKRIEQNIKIFLQESKLPIYAQIEKSKLLMHDLDYILSSYNRNVIDRYLAVQAIARIFYGNLDAIHSLIKFLNQEKMELFELAAFSLIEISPLYRFPLLVSELKPCLVELDRNNFVSSWRQRYACEVLWHCAQNMSYPDFYRAWHSSSSVDKLSIDGCEVKP